MKSSKTPSKSSENSIIDTTVKNSSNLNKSKPSKGSQKLQKNLVSGKQCYGSTNKSQVNHIYINNKTDLKAQLNHCKELLNSGLNIYIHSLGNAISIAVNICLILIKESNGSLTYEANTTTCENFDNVEPLHDDDEITVVQRFNSCLHIKIYVPQIE